MAVNDAGTTLFVTDRANRRIRSIDLGSGAVTTLAGSGTYGHQDGTGAAARFGAPTGLDIDAAGNLYVSEANHHTIRRVSPAGAVWTLAGTADNSGASDGVGGAARFFGPKDVALDRLGSLYVADAYNQSVRRIRLADQTVTTVAGTSGVTGGLDGPGTSATFVEPWGVAADAGGNVYASDIYLQSVRKIARDGYVTTVAGGTTGYVNGRRGSARFSGLVGLAADAEGGLYVADTDNHTIRRIK